MMSDSQVHRKAPNEGPLSKVVFVVVDYQLDFCEEGALAVPGAMDLLPLLKSAIARARDWGCNIVLTRDWHPPNHESFLPEGGPWPVHCVAGSRGAKFHRELPISDETWIVSKGTETQGMGYSAFESREFEARLKANDIKYLVVGGLALDFCVRATCIDALKGGYGCVLVSSLTRAVDNAPASMVRHFHELADSGCEVVTKFDESLARIV